MTSRHMARKGQATSADKDLQSYCHCTSPLMRPPYSIYCNNSSLSGQHALTLNKVSYNIDFQPRWHVGRDYVMITKGYKQTSKTCRRLSFSISIPSQQSISLSNLLVGGFAEGLHVPRWTLVQVFRWAWSFGHRLKECGSVRPVLPSRTVSSIILFNK